MFFGEGVREVGLIDFQCDMNIAWSHRASQAK